jgi:hypothetical protein
MAIVADAVAMLARPVWARGARIEPAGGRPPGGSVASVTSLGVQVTISGPSRLKASGARQLTVRVGSLQRDLLQCAKCLIVVQSVVSATVLLGPVAGPRYQRIRSRRPLWGRFALGNPSGSTHRFERRLGQEANAGLSVRACMLIDLLEQTAGNREEPQRSDLRLREARYGSSLGNSWYARLERSDCHQRRPLRQRTRSRVSACRRSVSNSARSLAASAAGGMRSGSS